jgi:hypothetical protein
MLYTGNHFHHAQVEYTVTEKDIGFAKSIFHRKFCKELTQDVFSIEFEMHQG